MYIKLKSAQNQISRYLLANLESYLKTGKTPEFLTARDGKKRGQ